MHIIAGVFKNRLLIVPKDSRTRPTSSRLRETLFNICQNFIEGAFMLDLCAGSGAIGLEALSRGAKSCTFVDNSKESIRCLEKNIAALGVKEFSQIYFGDVFLQVKKLASQGQNFDLIFADPPYSKIVKIDGCQKTYSQAIVHLVDTLPLLQPGGMLFIEEAVISPLKFDTIKTLELIKTRRSGDAFLYQLQKVAKETKLLES